jgi:predicted GNAT family acetyltransferase
MTEDKKLIFEKTKNNDEIKEVYNFNTEAFADASDFRWSVDSLKKELKEGWNLYSVRFDDEIVAAALTKKDADSLLTKNTAIKINFQGNGFSHMIKDWYEELAKEEGVHKIINYCPFDNFRMISLNERHNYKKTGKMLGDSKTIIEWEKSIK